MTIKHTLTEIVRPPNIAKVYFVRDEQVFYTIELSDGTIYMFPISFAETKGGIFYGEMPAMPLMRWVRMAMNSESLIKINKR